MQSIARLVLLCGSLSIAFALSAPKPALALTLAKREFTCPIGGEKFTANVVASQSQFGMRLDMRPIGAMLSPVPLPVCPGNGFVMFEREFAPDELKALEAIVLTDEYRQARRQHVDYYMVAFMRERMGAPPMELARLYQRASWEAEGSHASQLKRKPDKPELVAQYRALALQKFDAFLQQDRSHSGNWWTAAILSAELARLLGRFDAAEQRLDRLPMEKIPADAPVRKAIEQIRGHVAKRNAEPERLVSP
jgi:hypothetical protein